MAGRRRPGAQSDRETLKGDGAPGGSDDYEAHEHRRGAHVLGASREFVVSIADSIHRCFDGRVQQFHEQYEEQRLV